MPRACGSWRGSVRLSTRTRSPPTAATRSRRSVVVAATESVAATSTAAITTRRFASPLGEDRFRDHAVHALATVDDLRDAAVADHRRQRVGLVATEGHHLLAGEEVHRLARGDLHRLVEVLVETGGDPVGGRLDARPLELDVLAHDRLDDELAIRALERREVHLAVALATVRVARPDQRAFDEHRQIEDRALLQLVDVHVRAVLPRSQGARAPLGVLDRRARLLLRLVGIRRDGDGAGERLQIDQDAGLELRLLLLPVEVVVADEALREFRRELADGREL